ncbi:MAG: hypothetical protein IKZ56_00255 [Bacteroidales bacterium]|nr:hypothetical protein [Bacteroidales bacterium]
MLAKGFDPDLVAEIVGLTAEEVRQGRCSLTPKHFTSTSHIDAIVMPY